MKPFTVIFILLTNYGAKAQLSCPCELEYNDPWALPFEMNMTSSTDDGNPLDNDITSSSNTNQQNFSYPQWYQEQQNPPSPPTPLLVNIQYDVPQNEITEGSEVINSKPAITIAYSSPKTKRKSFALKKIKRKVKSVKYSGKCPSF